MISLLAFTATVTWHASKWYHKPAIEESPKQMSWKMVILTSIITFLLERTYNFILANQWRAHWYRVQRERHRTEAPVTSKKRTPGDGLFPPLHPGPGAATTSDNETRKESGMVARARAAGWAETDRTLRMGSR